MFFAFLRINTLTGLLLCLLATTSYGNYQWWNEKHNWDGVTHWSRYMIISPGFMGPNALPVPEIHTGAIRQGRSIEASYQRHFGGGDQTRNLFGRMFLPLFSERVGLNLEMVVVEHYRLDTLTRDLRKARNFDARGFSFGDLYIGTHIQLLEEDDRRPGLLLTLNLRTASGSNLDDARHTDNPGYHFDLSAGKSYYFPGKTISEIRPFVLAGFYVWQLYRTNFQNDAFLYGAGVQAQVTDHLSVTNTLGGYVGYLNNGDRPMVYRLKLEHARQNNTSLYVAFQHGIHDFPYNTFSFGYRYFFE